MEVSGCRADETSSQALSSLRCIACNQRRVGGKPGYVTYIKHLKQTLL
ncbi:MAG: hypothetical protein ACR9NN_20070 [Nostochopsis sp.]